MAMYKKGKKWFSTYFGLNIPQYELEFVDYKVSSDVRLYIDSYAITKDPTNLGIDCHNGIISYFTKLRNAVISKDIKLINELSRSYFSEQGQIHLGVSKTTDNGKGLGKVQETQIIKALSNSKAIQSNSLEGIQELELHIEGIGPDKISDLISNIIMSQLALFTEEMCSKYGIPTRPCAVSPFWDKDKEEWSGNYFNLPTNSKKSFVLVPKRFVRRDRDIMNHEEFYNKYLLDFIGRELISANDSLVKTLKSGEKKVTKESMKTDGRFMLNKQLISEYIIQHPQTIKKYREDLMNAYKPIDPAVYTGKNIVDDKKVEESVEKLKILSPGKKDATTYQQLVYRLLEFVFDWCLCDFSWEFKMDVGRGRIDILTTNISSGGLFEYLRSNLKALTIPIECKNYASDLSNNEFNQITDRMGKKTSHVGFIFCRSIADKELMRRHQSDRWLRSENLILLMDDGVLLNLIELRLARNFTGIEKVLAGLMRDVQYNTTK